MLLHLGLFAPLIISGGREPRAKPPDLDGGVLGAAADEFTTTLVFIDPTTIGADSENSFPSPAQIAPMDLEFALLVGAKAPTLDATAYESESDAAALAALHGKYTGQVLARIERGWERPSAVNMAVAFNCRVRIEQDRDGKVLTVELMECDDDSLWQMSLVAAIERASPLSPPPDPSVFASQLILNLSSDAIPVRTATLASAPSN